jgi:hypothetical protein
MKEVKIKAKITFPGPKRALAAFIDSGTVVSSIGHPRTCNLTVRYFLKQTPFDSDIMCAVDGQLVNERLSAN